MAEEGKALETYPYQDMIKEPSQIGVSDKGNLTALGNDIGAIQGYVNVLMSGDSKAQRASPLGNKFFFNTGTECTDLNGATQARFAYVNNIPDGKIIGKGLVPGILEDLAALNPSSLFNAFSGDKTCQEITMSTRDNSNNSRTESRYVLNSDIQTYNPCWFPTKRNPVSSAKCEGMTNRRGGDGPMIPDDPIVRLYMLGIGGITAYVMYRFMKK